MLCVCVGRVMNVTFSICIVKHGAAGTRVWDVLIIVYSPKSNKFSEL